MALTLSLFSFSKRHNSTAIPSGDGFVVDVALKRETSFNNPVFVLHGAKPTATYARFENAYYFIDDLRSIRDDVWELVCSIDPLATLRDAILATNAFVEYAAQGNGDIMDDRILPTCETTAAQVNGDLEFNATGHYNIAVVGLDGVNVYELTEGELRGVLSSISQWKDNLFLGATDAVDALIAGFGQLVSSGSAMDCIRSCKWLPFAKTGGSTLPLYLGLYDSGISASVVSSPFFRKSVTLTVPFTRTGYLRLQPYTDVFLYLPFVGVVNVSHPRLVETDIIMITMSRDNRTGRVAYVVSAGTTRIGTYGADTGSEYPVGVSNIAAGNLINASASAAQAYVTGNLVGTATGAFAASSPTTGAVGTIQGGAGAGLPLECALYCVEHDISGAPANMAQSQGVPLYANRQMSALSGYVKTRGFSVSGSYRDVLKQRVNEIMNSGAFLE